MILGYNPRNYLTNFLADLEQFYEERNIVIDTKCVDEQKDIYQVLNNNQKLFNLELWDITNIDNNLYQELKLTFDEDTDMLQILIKNDKVKCISITDNYCTFVIIDDILISK